MTSQPLILSLETSTLAGSIVIARGTEVLASKTGNREVSHSNTLLRDVNEVLETLKLTIRDVELFAVASGPGSFTGLRIGLATVKALATTLNRPCIGIPTLEAIASAAGPSEATVSLLPAGRGEVFVQMFSVSTEGQVVALDQPGHLPPARAIGQYRGRSSICWAGEASRVHEALIQQSGEEAGYHFIRHTNGRVESVANTWRIAETSLNLAEHVASLALSKIIAGQDSTAANLKALYVRPSDAEINL